MGLRMAARSYASAAANQDVQLPVKLFGLDGSYASALYVAAAKTNELSTAEKAVNALKDILSKDNKLQTILSNPSLTGSDKKIVIDTLSKAAGGDKITTNFLATLAENNRLSILGDVLKQFDILSDAANGRVEATVTSVEPLDAKTLARLEKAIAGSSLVGKGKTLNIKNKVVPDIKGGLIVEVGDRTVDASVAAKLTRLNKLLNDSI
jgi:F-type H+-transporting ATPase subunit O